jgi:hypothetical protein
VPNSLGRFEFGNNSPKPSAQIGKKRKIGGNVGKIKMEKKFRKEDMFGHSGSKYEVMKKPTLLTLFVSVQISFYHLNI